MKGNNTLTYFSTPLFTSDSVWRSTLILSFASCYLMWGESFVTLFLSFPPSRKIKHQTDEIRILTSLLKTLCSNRILRPMASPHRSEVGDIASWDGGVELKWSYYFPFFSPFLPLFLRHRPQPGHHHRRRRRRYSFTELLTGSFLFVPFFFPTSPAETKPGNKGTREGGFGCHEGQGPVFVFRLLSRFTGTGGPGAPRRQVARTRKRERETRKRQEGIRKY